MTEHEETLVSMMTICNPELASNPVAWHNLHKQGITIDLLKQISEQDGWIGPKPCFDQAPEPTNHVWIYLEELKE